MTCYSDHAQTFIFIRQFFPVLYQLKLIFQLLRDLYDFFQLVTERLEFYLFGDRSALGSANLTFHRCTGFLFKKNGKMLYFF